MIEGLFKVDFETPIGSGSGAVVLRNGIVEGGDSMMAYRGTYTFDQTNQRFVAQIDTFEHTPVVGMSSVLGNSKAKIKVWGTFTAKGDYASLEGVTEDASKVPFKGNLSAI